MPRVFSSSSMFHQVSVREGCNDAATNCSIWEIFFGLRISHLSESHGYQYVQTVPISENEDAKDDTTQSNVGNRNAKRTKSLHRGMEII